MKKHFLICIALVAIMASCVKEPDIFRRLTPEDAAAIPYRMGEKVTMLNQDGQTLNFVVVSDTTGIAYNYEENFYRPQTRVIIPTNPDFYMREVVLQESSGTTILRCKVGYDKVINLSLETHPEGSWNGYWQPLAGGTLGLNQLSTQTVTIDGTVYDKVYYEEHTIETDSIDIPYYCYYSEEYGLIAMKYGDNSLQRIP